MFLFCIPRQLKPTVLFHCCPFFELHLHQFISVDELFFSYAGFCFRFLL